MNKTPLAIFSSLVVAAGAATLYYGTHNGPSSAVAPPAVVAKLSEPPPVAKPEPAAAPLAAQIPVPSFDTARVSPDGDAVIAGRAAPGAEVALTLNGTTIGSAKANAAGEFVIVPAKPIPPGQGALSLETSVDGKMTHSDQTVAVSVKPKAAAEATVAVLSPAAPPRIIQAPKPSGDSASIDAVDYDAAGSIQFSGRAHAGNTVRLYVDNTALGEAKTDATGNWSYKDQGVIAPGTHELRADEIEQAGSVLSRVVLPFKREEPAKLAVATPVPAAGDQAAATPPHSITIQPGNTLWRLSRDLYGAGRNYTVIFEANKDQIRNPRLIYPGQILTTPTKAGN